MFELVTLGFQSHDLSQDLIQNEISFGGMKNLTGGVLGDFVWAQSDRPKSFMTGASCAAEDRRIADRRAGYRTLVPPE